MDFNQDESLILNYIQRTVPLVERPFRQIGEELDMPEADVMRMITDLKRRNIIRNIAGIFSPKSLGYTIGLVGMEIPEGRINLAATVVNSHPGVSHNYIRSHRINMWFTLAEENKKQFDNTVSYMAEKVGAADSLVLKTEQVYKIGVNLPIGKKETQGNRSPEMTMDDARDDLILSEEEKHTIRVLQQDLPIAQRPFLNLTAKASCRLEEEEVLSIAAILKKKGIMRRYSAVLRHMNAGFSHNAMTVWKVLPEEKDAAFLVDAFSRERAVTHLYMRTYLPGRWEYPLFAMIHAQTEERMQEIISRLSDTSGVRDYQVLRSVRELKKERVSYFSPDFSTWRHSAGFLG